MERPKKPVGLFRMFTDSGLQVELWEASGVPAALPPARITVAAVTLIAAVKLDAGDIGRPLVRRALHV